MSRASAASGCSGAKQHLAQPHHHHLSQAADQLAAQATIQAIYPPLYPTSPQPPGRGTGLAVEAESGGDSAWAWSDCDVFHGSAPAYGPGSGVGGGWQAGLGYMDDRLV